MPWHLGPLRFPPPIRFTAPVLALAFGLMATWFDYRLNLDLGLARHFEEMRRRAESNGGRLAQASAQLLAANDRDGLQLKVETIPDLPEIELAGVVDEKGRIIVDSKGDMRGRPVTETPLAQAAGLINSAGQPVIEREQNGSALLSAHPFHLGEHGTGWALLVFDRGEAIAAARSDARTQLVWMALAMALLSLVLWAVLHFGFAERLARLARSVEAFGEGTSNVPEVLRGGDEVASLSEKFAFMATRLRERDAAQLRLEREVLEISESERRRMGHDVHDSLGQRLTAASLTTNALLGALKKGAPALIEHGEEIGRQLRDAIAETRALSHGLAPVALLADGLTGALGTLAENTGHLGSVRCIFESTGNVRVTDPEVAGHLYRIAQEAVNNALKHAAPSEIRLGLERQHRHLVLEIEDDGEGFNEATPAVDGIGLRVMRYRARLIDGLLEIGSAPAGGTRIVCRVQLPA
ncbi:MAG: sensor histidine kinase [Chthoniobacterales bacterium]